MGVVPKTSESLETKGFLAAFTGDEDLTQQEIEEMKEWIDKL